MSENKENLDELLTDFFDPAEALQVKRDIELGDEIFIRNPAPVPDEQLLVAIKTNIAVDLARNKRKRVVFLTIGKVATVAAVFIVTALIGLMFFVHDSSDMSTLAKNIWQDDAFVADEELLALKTQVDEIADEIRQIRLDELDEDYDVDTIQWEIEEMEMVANNTDFWKG